jgi:hypothetical protein
MWWVDCGDTDFGQDMIKYDDELRCHKCAAKLYAKTLAENVVKKAKEVGIVQ